jgi:hypothetical protein
MARLGVARLGEAGWFDPAPGHHQVQFYRIEQDPPRKGSSRRSSQSEGGWFDPAPGRQVPAMPSIAATAGDCPDSHAQRLSSLQLSCIAS